MIEKIKKIVINDIEEKGKSEGKDEWQIDDEIKEVEKAQRLSSLGFNLVEAIQLLQDNNIPVVLTEEDKNKIETQEKILKEKSDFVCVHKTKYIPVENRIKSAKEAGVVSTKKIEIEDKEYDVQYKHERNTVHFCVNGEVTNNTGGDWDECKYAIIVPLESIDTKQIKGALPVDLYTEGGVTLDESSWILCPRGESKKIKKQNDKINVIEYDGENVTGYANILLQYLGYDYKEGGFWEWINDTESQKNFYDLLEKEGVPNLRMGHVYSYSGKVEKDKTLLNILSEKMRILKKENKLNSIEDINKLSGNMSVSISTLDEDEKSIYIQEMLEYLKENGISIPNSYEKILLSATKIINNVNDRNKNEVTTFFEGLQTENLEEKMVNARLQTIFEQLSDTGGYGIRNVNSVFTNLLKFSYFSQKEETKGIINEKEECKNIVSNGNIEKLKKKLIKIMNNPEQARTIFGEEELRDGYFSYTRDVDSFGSEKGYNFSSPQGQKQSYMIVANDFRTITEPLTSEHKGYINLRYNDNGKSFDIKYRKGENEPKFQMDGIDVLEEKFFNLIQDTPQKGEFERIYYMLSHPNLCQAIENTFPVEENELSKSIRTESHRLTTKQLGKSSINAETLDKQQISQELEKWRTREEEKTVDDQ